jgi:transposase-like protein
MANPIAIAVALSRLVTITCPHCGQKKTVQARPATHRVCPRCRKQFPDPLKKPSSSMSVARTPATKQLR